MEINKAKEAGNIAGELEELLKSETEHDYIDALADIVVFAINAIEKAGYNPEVVLHEVCDELDDRTGYYDAATGKWLKMPPKQGAHKANFNNAKIGEKDV